MIFQLKIVIYIVHSDANLLEDIPKKIGSSLWWAMGLVNWLATGFPVTNQLALGKLT